MNNGLYHIQDNKIYKMSLNEPMKQVGTAISDEAVMSIIDTVTEYMYCNYGDYCMEKITWAELQKVRNEIKENAMEMIKGNLDIKRWFQKKETEIDNMRLPQELFAEALWIEWFTHYGVICKEKLPDLLRLYNLKLKKGNTLNDIQLILGRAFKDTLCFSSKQIGRIAEETDKVCVIANWEDAAAKYKV